jgi:hypothetical protein
MSHPEEQDQVPSNSPVLSSLQMKTTQFKNRVLVAPLTNEQSDVDGELNDSDYGWLKPRAEGGFGGVITAAAYVDDLAKTYRGQLGASKDSQIPGLQRLAGLGREYDMVPILQLVHGGSRSTFALTGRPARAPSRVRINIDLTPDAQAMTQDEIEGAIEKFVEAPLERAPVVFPGSSCTPLTGTFSLNSKVPSRIIALTSGAAPSTTECGSCSASSRASVRLCQTSFFLVSGFALKMPSGSRAMTSTTASRFLERSTRTMWTMCI